LPSRHLVLLQGFFSDQAISQLLAIFNRVLESPHRSLEHYGFAKSEPIQDKGQRSSAHAAIREIFHERLESKTMSGNIISVSASQEIAQRKGKSKSNQGRGRNQQNTNHGPTNWKALGGEFLHFSLFKENRDTSEVISFICRMMKLRNHKIFDFAGNKDRRAVTVQRVCAYKITADRLLALNTTMRGSLLGGFGYSQNKIRLGDLMGNEFIITLRECHFRDFKGPLTPEVLRESKAIVERGMNNLYELGFINYFGLQRFGSFAAKTDLIGMYMLQGNCQAAVEKILEFSPYALEAATNPGSSEMISKDDKDRALGLQAFKDTPDDINRVLSILPKRFAAETAMVKFLSSSFRRKQYRGALESIPRNTRSLYVHAYQSRIWNMIASHRWKLAGRKVMIGDIVLISEHRDKLNISNQGTPEAVTNETVDVDGEEIVHPAADDRAIAYDDHAEKGYALTEEDVASGKYNIHDVVLPLPGYDVIYPSYLIKYYESTMAEHGNLSPHEMKRSWKDASLPGDYRKFLARPLGDFGCEVLSYTDPDTKLVQTDVDKLGPLDKIIKPAKGQKAKDIDNSWRKQDDKQDKSKQDVTVENGDNKLLTSLSEQQAQKESPNTSPPSGIALEPNITPGEHLAVVLRFQLGTSMYATMALRELMKPGPVEYKPDFSTGRQM
jgi:tRNA pseudouridine13 synthase